MNPEDRELVGVLTKTQGKQGELLLKIKKGFPPDLPPEGPVFIPVERENEGIPFYLTRCQKLGKERYILSFDLIDSEKRASRLVGYEVWLPRTAYPEEDREDLLLEKVKGFRVIDREQGDLGIIESGFERSEQPVAYVGDDRIPIPLTDALIETIDTEQGIIYTQLPEGLTEL